MQTIDKRIEETKELSLLLKNITVNNVIFTSDGEAIDVIEINAVDSAIATELANNLICLGYRKASEIAKEIGDKIAKNLYKVKSLPQFVAIKATVLIDIIDEYKKEE